MYMLDVIPGWRIQLRASELGGGNAGVMYSHSPSSGCFYLLLYGKV